MTEADPGIDAIIRIALPAVKTSPEFIEAQKPKPVLIASGLARPPMHEQVVPVGVARIGQIAFVIGPAEYSTMSGRRFRAAVGRELGIDPNRVIVAGYANDFAGYVTTWHEYQMQHYEGGHTLFGPWTEAGYRQEFVRLARAMKSGEPVRSEAEPTDMRTLPYRTTLLDGPDERKPEGADFGDVVVPPQETYTPGEVVSVTFWTGLPVNDYDRHDRFLAVERFSEQANSWQVIRGDDDWDTAAQWQRVDADGRPPRRKQRAGIFDLAPPRYAAKPDPFQVTIQWETTVDTPPGAYRIVHFGRAKQDGQVRRFTTYSPPFEIGG